MPDRSRRSREEAIFGTGPHWAVIENHLYKLTPSSVCIASLFPLSSSLTIPLERTGPVLECLDQTGSSVEVRNPELQPEARLTLPVPHLMLSLRSIPRELGLHIPNELEIVASLDFRYPEPEERVVYLPNHEEARCSQILLNQGFVFEDHSQRYSASGDAALNFINYPKDTLPEEWVVEGLQSIQKEVRFSELILDLSILRSQETALGDEEVSFDCTVSLFQNGANIPISALFKSASQLSDRWLKLDGGSYARVPGGSLARLKSTLGVIDSNLSLSNSVRRRVSTTQALSLTSTKDTQIVFSLDDRIQKLKESLESFTKIQPSAPRKGFKGQLRSYQKESVGWLKFLHKFNLAGILADEMGLGKTVQTLAFLQYLKNSRQEMYRLNKPVLIVAPTSVVTNWYYETKSFTPNLKALILQGPQRKQLFKSIPDHDIIITSYSLIRMDRNELSKHSFSYIILDEAQNIKNPSANTTKSVKVLKADHRLALTGTPTENRPQELWSIFDFLMPGYLGSLQSFKTTFEKAILEQGPSCEPGLLLRDKIRPFILRRTKAEVEKELPPKIESCVFADMLPAQQTLYKEFLRDIRPKLFEQVAQKGVRGASIPILSALLRLRQVCNHPSSIKNFKELGDWSSGKFEALKELLQEAFENNRKILLFSQFRSMLHIIRDWVDTTKTPYLYLDGLTKDRQALVDQFNADESIRMFLISLKAGGAGLNLTGADTVILYDPWWNPAVEAQAVDRAHRIGQQKSVNVYRFVTSNSIEEKMIRLKERKSEMIDSLIEGAGTTSLSLSKSDLEDLLTIPDWD
jgi:non-specific serine/threonine protein kinase